MTPKSGGGGGPLRGTILVDIEEVDEETENEEHQEKDRRKKNIVKRSQSSMVTSLGKNDSKNRRKMTDFENGL